MPRIPSDGRPPRPTVKRQLTDMLIRSLNPESRPYNIYDSRQRGLVLRIEPTGRRSFKCYYSRHGRPRWLHIGAADAIPLADARKLAAATMLRVAVGEDPQADRMAQRSAGTFGELVSEFLRSCGNKSAAQYEAQLRRHALPLWARMPAAAVSRADVRRLFDSRKAAAPASAKQLIAALSAAFGWAMHREWGGIQANPARGIASAKHDKTLKAQSRDRVLSDEELPAFWAAWEKAGLVHCMALRTVLLTGQRPGEVCHMRWQDIEPAEGGAWWTLPGQPEGQWPGTKSGKPHIVWLTGPVLALMDEASEGRREGLAFAGARGRPIRLDAAMREACAALGIGEAARPHDLRRTWSTLATRLGFSRDAMNRATGHAEGGIASVYDRWEYRPELRQMQEKVGTFIEGVINNDSDVIVLDSERKLDPLEIVSAAGYMPAAPFFKRPPPTHPGRGTVEKTT